MLANLPSPWQRAQVWLGGLLLWAGCLWILIWSPSLTAAYMPDFTREFFDRVPWAQPAFVDVPLDPPAMVLRLQIGLLLLIAGYLVGVFGLARANTRPGTRTVVGFALLSRLTLLALPGLFSTDIFSYVMAGRISAVYQANPYITPPSDFPSDPFYSWVFPFWRETPTVYGPLWTTVSWALSTLSGGWTNFDQVLLYRAVLAAFDLLTLWAMWRVLGLVLGGGQVRTVALCAFAWNPLWLFDIVGNAHNDVLMVLLLVGGVWLALMRQPLPSIASTTLSALVKLATGAVLLLDLVRLASGPDRWKRLGGACALIVVLTGVCAWPWFTSPVALTAMFRLGGGGVVINSVPEMLAHALGNDEARSTIRLIALLLFCGYFAWEVRNVYRQRATDARYATVGVTRAGARALLLGPLLLSSAVWSWYFSWSLALAVVSGWNSWLTRLVLLYTLFMPPVVYFQQYLNSEAYGFAPVAGALGPLAVCAVWYAFAGRRPRLRPASCQAQSTAAPAGRASG